MFVVLFLHSVERGLCFDWSGCHERQLPSTTAHGNCTFSSDACINAFDGNLTTFYPVGVLQRNTNLFGQLRSVEEGPDTNSNQIGINLGSAKAVLTRVVITPHPNVSEWAPYPHAYNPPVAWINWTDVMVGGAFQGSNDAVSWTDIYNITIAPAQHPLNTTFIFANFSQGACRGFGFFRYYNSRNATRRYFVNTEYGPMEKIETISLASVSELAFFGVPAADPDDLSCLAEQNNLAVVATPHTGVYLTSVNVTLFSPLLTCGAEAYYTLNGADPTTSSQAYVQGTSIAVAPASTSQGTIQMIRLSVVLSISGALTALRQFTYAFGQRGTTALCGVKGTSYQGTNSFWLMYVCMYTCMYV